MSDLKISLATLIFTFVFFTGVIGTEITYGQSSAPFANCITYKDLNAVMMSMDEDCSEQQFNEAITHYKANGYPNEGSYTDMLGEKSIELDTTEVHITRK